MSTLHHVDVQASSLLEIALGLAATIRGFDMIVDTYAPPHERTETTEPAKCTLELVLGAIAIRNRIAVELGTCESAIDRPSTEPPHESWLR